MLLLYLIKLIAVTLLGPFYFVAAVTAYLFNEDGAIGIYKSYERLIFKAFDIQISFKFDSPEIENSTNSILVVLNQSSFLDSLVCPLIPIRPFKGIINFEFALYPIQGWLAALGSFVIIRQWPNQAKRVLSKTNDYLQAGGNILISIEGKRSRNGEISEYKKGPIVMAINNHSNIVPIIIYGSRACLPFGSLRVRPGSIELRFLKPISTKDLAYEDRNVLLERITAIAKMEGLLG